MRIADAGRVVFAATFVALGVAGLVTRDFAAIWQPVPKSWPAALAYAASAGCVLLGAGMLWRRTATASAGVLTAWLVVWMAIVKAPAILHGPGEAAAWESLGETTVIAAAASAIAARFVAEGAPALALARAAFGLALIAFGASHFAYLKLTAGLVPGWLPWPVGWAALTGAAYAAAGLAVLTGVWSRLAATLAAAQMGLFTFLVWAPVIAAGAAKASDWSEAVVSWTLTVAAWVVAESYSGRPWLEVRTARRPAIGSRLSPG